MKFPNKSVENTYNKIKDRTFTQSPSFQVFTDQDGCKEYKYWDMVWLLDNGYIERLPFDINKGICWYFKRKD